MSQSKPYIESSKKCDDLESLVKLSFTWINFFVGQKHFFAEKWKQIITSQFVNNRAKNIFHVLLPMPPACPGTRRVLVVY